MMTLTIVAGARPNFIKIAPLIQALHNQADGKITYRLVHTGQHYDKQLSDTFFEELGIPEPDVNLGVGSGSQSSQTAQIMVKFEEELANNPCDYVVVVGDVNSTLACSVVAKKMQIGLIHIEAGIRSFDLTMPEEINRMVTDSLADYFFTTSEYANTNLLRSGVANERIFFVGNIMIDTLISNKGKYRKPEFWNDMSLIDKQYWILTLHRPSNVDNLDTVVSILQTLDLHSNSLPIIFPIHPRTRNILNSSNVHLNNVHIVSPLSYHRFMYLVQHCIGVITDSGGIQEETTVFDVPCLTMRKNTERPETVESGTNELITEISHLPSAMSKVQTGKWKKGNIPQLWDGQTAQRIVQILLSNFVRP
jgi:UDP-N-acetylglucosamine 2-epimerase (non-hydrolysing)